MNLAVLAKNEKIDFFIAEWSNFNYSLEKKIIEIRKKDLVKFKKVSGNIKIELVAN